MIGLTPLLPVKRGAKGPPLIDKWQERTPEELEEQYLKHPGCNVGVRLDTLTHVDSDNSEATKLVARLLKSGELPPTLTYLTWRGSQGLLYRARPGLKSFDVTANGLKLQIRTDRGHYALIPDSIHQGKFYTWVKHLGPADVDLADLPDAVLAHLQSLSLNSKVFSSTRGCHDPVTEGRLDFQKGGRDNSLYHVARTLFKGGMTPQDAEQVIKILAKNCSPVFSEKDAFAKIQSAFKGERNLTQEIRDWLSVTKALLSVPECDAELGIVTKRDKDARRQVFCRLVKDNILERIAGRVGVYRVIEKECNELDFLTADVGAPQPIKWPFDLQTLVNIYKKNLIIVAGSKDAGKTAFLLNTILLNMNTFKTVYFSSEMGEQELALRLSKFDYPMNSWNFKAYERASNFADAIEPDGLNFIDYLEITDNFYLIGGELRKIYDKLNNGLAVIAVQKDEKKDLARGGAFSLEKARLYVTLDRRDHYNELKVITGKNWAQPGHNPKGKTFKFKLVNGCSFKPA